jgi:hypothetical protein
MTVDQLHDLCLLVDRRAWLASADAIGLRWRQFGMARSAVQVAVEHILAYAHARIREADGLPVSLPPERIAACIPDGYKLLRPDFSSAPGLDISRR